MGDFLTRKILLLILAALTTLVGIGSYLQSTVQEYKKVKSDYFQQKQQYQKAEQENPVRISK